MREILFRGKRLDTGKWIEGYYVNNGVDVIAVSRRIHNTIFYAVEPETVGQFTGMVDPNGNKIFEGDIVDILTENEEHGYIEFEDGAFIVVANGFCVDFVNNLHSEDVRVISNIYDNPELLKGVE